MVLIGRSGVSVAKNALVAVGTCFIAEAMDGAFCLKLSAVRPLAAVCRAANAVFTSCTLGWRTGLRLFLAFHSTCQNPRAEGAAANLAARQRIDIQASGPRTVIGAIARFVPSVVGCPEVKDQ
jgi:hypothetical protein